MQLLAKWLNLRHSPATVHFQCGPPVVLINIESPEGAFRILPRSLAKNYCRVMARLTLSSLASDPHTDGGLFANDFDKCLRVSLADEWKGLSRGRVSGEGRAKQFGSKQTGNSQNIRAASCIRLLIGLWMKCCLLNQFGTIVFAICIWSSSHAEVTHTLTSRMKLAYMDIRLEEEQGMGRDWGLRLGNQHSQVNKVSSVNCVIHSFTFEGEIQAAEQSIPTRGNNHNPSLQWHFYDALCLQLLIVFTIYISVADLDRFGPRRVHAARLKGNGERALRSLPDQDIQEDRVADCQRTEGGEYSLSACKPALLQLPVSSWQLAVGFLHYAFSELKRLIRQLVCTHARAIVPNPIWLGNPSNPLPFANNPHRPPWLPRPKTTWPSWPSSMDATLAWPFNWSTTCWTLSHPPSRWASLRRRIWNLDWPQPRFFLLVKR